jgi:hypothetical protein
MAWPIKNAPTNALRMVAAPKQIIVRSPSRDRPGIGLSKQMTSISSTKALRPSPNQSKQPWQRRNCDHTRRGSYGNHQGAQDITYCLPSSHTGTLKESRPPPRRTSPGLRRRDALDVASSEDLPALGLTVAQYVQMDSWLVPDWAAVQIAPTALHRGTLPLRARARQQRMQGDAMSYGTTSEEMNVVGLMGEDAVANWLAGQGAEVCSIADEADSIASGQGDLEVSFKPAGWTRVIGLVEVKTSRRRDYLRLERTVIAGQLSRMNCHAVFWCTVANDLAPGAAVDIMGWLPRAEVQEAAFHEPTVARGRPAVRIKRPLRDPRGFLAWLETEARTLPPF